MAVRPSSTTFTSVPDARVHSVLRQVIVGIVMTLVRCKQERRARLSLAESGLEDGMYLFRAYLFGEGNALESYGVVSSKYIILKVKAVMVARPDGRNAFTLTRPAQAFRRLGVIESAAVWSGQT
jgi:hypothetical protein